MKFPDLKLVPPPLPEEEQSVAQGAIVPPGELGLAVDPLEREDVYKILFMYLAGTAAIVVAGLFFWGVHILPRGNIHPIEWGLLLGLSLGVPAHVYSFYHIRRLSKEALKSFAFGWMLFNSFILSILIYLCGTHTAILSVFLFSQLGMATVILDETRVRWFTVLMFAQFAALVFLQVAGILPHEEILLGMFDYRRGPVQIVTILSLIGGAMFAVYSWTMYVRRKLEQARRELAVLATTDRLTGLANRRTFDNALAREVRRCKRTGRSVALILCDADHFKNVNDQYGHSAGDEVLRQIAAVLLGSVRVGTDTPARYGGEEFAVILPETELEGAKEVAQRICRGVRHLRFERNSNNFRVTISIGVTALHGEATDMDVLIETADNLLYRAKKSGRDRVVAGTVEELSSD